MIILALIAAVAIPSHAQNCSLEFNSSGLAMDHAGHHREAILEYTHAIECDPSYPKPYVNRGVAKAALGEYMEAIKDYTKAIALKPKDALAHYDRGVAYNYLNQWTRSIADYDTAIKLRPNYKKRVPESRNL